MSDAPAWLVPDWPAPVGVRALSSFRSGGVSAAQFASLNLGDRVNDAPDHVAVNRRRLCAAAVLPAEPSWLEQVHGTRVANLDLERHESRLPADGVMTRHGGRICAILTADCLPVLLAAKSGGAVAAAHAGWRGLAAGVIECTVHAMGLPASAVVAWLGPAIGPRHFEIGPEVREALLAGDPGAAGAFTLNARGRFMADLFALAKRRLKRAGVDSVHGGGECTYADPVRYFSHRRDGITGRQATLIWLE